MKKIANLIGLALAAAFARADVTSATEWQDVPPDMTLGAVAAGAGLAKTGDCARAVAQEAKDRADAIAALTSASITNADPARVFEGKPGTMSDRVIVSDGSTSLVLDENFITRHTKTDGVAENNVYWFPSFSGTLALTADIPTVPTAVSAFENDAGYLTAHQSLADYAKTATLNAYSNELATAIANSAPADYANVSNKAVNAAQASALAKVATSGSYADLSNKPTIPTISATDATFSNAVNAAARALVKSKLESLDKAKSSIGETIAALQSIYETETK